MGRQMPYEVFDHTAAIGLRITARTVEELFAEAGRALISLIVENPEDIELRQSRTIQPDAYKDLDAVVDVVHQAGLSKKVARCRPLGVIKG
jgi:SHS2 domain-containing protein